MYQSSFIQNRELPTCPVVPGYAEVNTINRQKFLAELSKLLTFMYEEDRQRALSMYERMFDITEDEQGLIQHLVSPTRQAVIIARAYDAKERKLSVSSQVRGDTEEAESSEIPKFVLAINKIFDDLFPDSAEDVLEEDQVSFYDLGLAQKEDFVAAKPAVPAGAVLLSDTQKFRLDPLAAEAGEADEAETAAADDAPDADFVPADETVSVEPDSADETQDFLTGGATIDELITAWKKDLEADMNSEPDAPADDAATEVPAAAEELPEQETEEEISSEELPASSAEEASAPEEAPVEEAAEETPEDTEDTEMPETEGAEGEAAMDSDIAVEASDGADAVEEAAPVPEAPIPAGSRKNAAAPQEASIPKTILFLLVAIPVALLLLALLLIPTMLFVGVSAGLIILGATLAVSAFSGFSVLADLLLLIGAALVTLALGLLFLWLTVWTIGGGMGGVIRTIGDLHRKLCMKKGVSEE